MIALAKINNNNVKYTSNKWDNESIKILMIFKLLLSNRSQIKIKDFIFSKQFIKLALYDIFNSAKDGKTIFFFTQVLFGESKILSR